MQVADAVHSMLPQGRAVLAVGVALVRAAPVPVHAPVLRWHAQLHTDARQRAASQATTLLAYPHGRSHAPVMRAVTA